MQPIKLSTLQVFRRSVAMVIQASPRELSYLTVLTLINGAGPAIALFLNKIIIDEVSRLLGKEITANSIHFIQQQPVLLGSILGLILLNLLSDTINTITNLVVSSLRDRVRGFTQGKVLNKVANFADIALFETPELLNLIQLSEKSVERLQELSFIIISSLNGFFIFIPAILLSGSIAWWIPLILFTSSAPAIYVELKYRKQSWEVEETQASIAREIEIYKDVLISEAYAKELRLFHLQPLLLKRWQSFFRQMFRAMQQVRRQGTIAIVTWSMLSGFGTVLPYIYVILGTLQGTYTLGDLALYAGLILQVRQSLFLLIGNGSDLYDVVLGTTPIFQLLELKPQLQPSLPDTEHTVSRISDRKIPQTQLKNCVIEKQQGIQVQNVSFSYPGSDRLILENINLTIQPNETIALVGENGAGKTTLAKLLCRLYDPHSGKILWQDKDLRELELDELRSRIAVVMQDYAQFPTTVRENVGFGYLPSLANDRAIADALKKAGMAKVVEELAQSLETPLGKKLVGGVELSQGQWQRIAIARFLMRLPFAELLVFDEPTAALDPKTEYEIYQLFRTVASDKMAIVISHRLGLSKIADRIVVLENGKIIEVGDRNELIQLGGQYYLMFTRQASSYLSD